MLYSVVQVKSYTYGNIKWKHTAGLLCILLHREAALNTSIISSIGVVEFMHKLLLTNCHI